MKLCPTCGHPMVQLTEVERALSITQRRIFKYVEAAGTAGLDIEALRERMYGRNAGAENIISAHLVNMRRVLRPLGLTIRTKHHTVLLEAYDADD